jgi:hypothetical protein
MTARVPALSSLYSVGTPPCASTRARDAPAIGFHDHRIAGIDRLQDGTRRLGRLPVR